MKANTYTCVDPMVVSKLCTIMDAISDRVEMHKNIGERHNNWNILLLTSINGITLCAVTITSLAASTSSTSCSNVNPLKLAFIILYLSATGMLIVINKIQPSQLAEEQRISSRLFKQLHAKFQTTLTLGVEIVNDVNEAMENALALDKAYPLHLLRGTMLNKFPSVMGPAAWWPQQRLGQGCPNGKINGWSRNLEEEMRNISKVIKRKDMAKYIRLNTIALQLNRFLAISGPLLTGLAAIGSSFVGTTCGSWPVMLGLSAGVLATDMDVIEHGGQVGMVFEMYHSNASLFKFMEETIDSNIAERDTERRENGEVLEMKLVLQLGKSIPELRNLAASSCNLERPHEFASKIF